MSFELSSRLITTKPGGLERYFMRLESNRRRLPPGDVNQTRSIEAAKPQQLVLIHLFAEWTSFHSGLSSRTSRKANPTRLKRDRNTKPTLIREKEAPRGLNEFVFLKNLDQPRDEADLSSRQCLRNRTALFGVLRVLLKRSIVQTGYFGFGLECDAGYRECFADLLELDCCVGVNTRGGDVRARQRGRKRHGETTGMRGANQLFRIGGRLAFFKSRLERIWTIKRAAADFQSSTSLCKIT